MGCSRVLVPATASALSASGMQFSDIVFEHSASALTRTNDFDFAAANRALDAIRAELERFTAGLGDRARGRVRTQYFVEARYLFQIWELDVPLATDRFASAEDVRALDAAFDAAHERVFAVVDTESPVECVTWKGRVTIALGDDGDLPAPAATTPSAPAPERRRRAYFGGGRWVDAPIHLGASLAPGAEVPGPAVIEETTTTIVVFPGMTARRTAAGNTFLDIAT
jgi:N-methylhydantoinase A